MQQTATMINISHLGVDSQCETQDNIFQNCTFLTKIILVIFSRQNWRAVSTLKVRLLKKQTENSTWKFRACIGICSSNKFQGVDFFFSGRKERCLNPNVTHSTRHVFQGGFLEELWLLVSYISGIPLLLHQHLAIVILCSFVITFPI